MPVKNNYWKVLNKTPRFYTAWPGGWEVHVVIEEVEVRKKGSIGSIRDTIMDKNGNPLLRKEARLRMPKMPKESRRNLKIQIARDKRIAQSVTSKSEYESLWKRIDEGDWDFIEKNDLKDRELIDWAYNTRTADEYYRLLRYN